nr:MULTISPECIES: hypothetical protein [unclassified Tardiphaga]
MGCTKASSACDGCYGRR